ncbi:MAG: hypothetical protein HY698_14085 [Deltaproteobacteria bacterium]|nr:hypothetical protein [Deltaproteobacteria bacterium]
MSSTSLVLLFLAGCPDPKGRFNEFSARIPDAAIKNNTADAGGSVPDVNGTFYMGFAASLDYDRPIRLICENELKPKDEKSWTLSLHCTPLTKDKFLPVGDTVHALDGVVDETGHFKSDFGEVNIKGAANPFSSNDIVGNLKVDGTIRSKDRLCGDGDGALIRPFEFNLAGSKFSMIRVPKGTEGAALPPIETSCPKEEIDAGPTPEADASIDAAAEQSDASTFDAAADEVDAAQSDAN